ncbi:MAG: hypothetical protein K2W96_27215, partial [Gemmataceae bacterium]|nr:hypothetical protein [Gemmataceae bacterium]
MSWSSRRAVSALAAVTLLGTLSLVGFVYGQRIRPPRPPIGGGDPKMPPGGGGPGAKPVGVFDLGNLTLPKDDDLKERVEAATDNITNAVRAERNMEKAAALDYWKKATGTLQDLLQRKEDVFVPLTRLDGEGREATVYVSVKKEALRLIGSLPKSGRVYYESTYGEGAKTAVKESKGNNDFLRMSDTFARLMYTEAGLEAGVWLGTYMLDRAEYEGASRFYQQLIARVNGDFSLLHNKTLLKAAYAFNAAGDKLNRDAVLAILEGRKDKVEFKLGDGDPLTVADVRGVFDKLVVSVSQQSASDSPMYRGTAGRSALMPGGTPFLEPKWRKPLASVDATKQQIRAAEDAIRSRALPILSGTVPVTATTMKGGKQVSQLVFRTWKGIQAVDMRNGEVAWDSTSDLSLDETFGATGMLRDGGRVGAYSNWLSAFNQIPGPGNPYSRPQMLLENTVKGTLSADSRYVYAIEDLPVPAPANMANPGAMGLPGFPRNIADALSHNKLLAYDMQADGYVRWEAGGTDAKHPLGETYFMGPPLPLNGKLYVLGEKQQELRLISLDPTGEGKGKSKTAKILGIQPLANVKNIRMVNDPLRRTQACHLAYGEGIMVVPTNNGAIFGVDVVSSALLWAYPYAEAGAAPVPP